MIRQLQYRSLWISVLMLAHPMVAAAQEQPRIERTDPVTVVVVILIASFAIERVVTVLVDWLARVGALGAASRSSVSRTGATAGASSAEKAVRFLLAGLLSVAVIYGFNGRGIFTRLGFTGENGFPLALDLVLTWLVLVAGSDRIAELVKKMGGEAGGKKAEPLEIKGTVILSEEPAKKATGELGAP